ncbi:hypothetical protein NGM10_01990 [Halorussus salilacus]|uniref:hypothetical protein n=1 Tax=Halorussus salilacus TaxID=2953750 RepID=UPI0020A16E2D|nr:hypothetical protein [Halorussus salilacus]USZ68523.1 hypothetical protein NGM10_01990 [Halorussus salilacus]
MRILVIDQCSKQKEYPDNVSPLGTDVLDAHSLDELQARDDTPAIEARELYTGRQQRKITEGIRMLEQGGHEVERYFISAGFGFVEDTERLPPYDVTFAEMSDAEIDERAEQLGIADDVQAFLETELPYDIVYFALGKDYYRSINLEATLRRVPDESIGLVFNQDDDVEQFSNVVSLSARNEEAKQFETIVVALKGEYLKNLARSLARSQPVPNKSEIVDYCTSKKSSQVGFTNFNE